MDTLALSRSLMEKLREAGFDEKQARALAESQAEAAEAAAQEHRRELATKGDIAELRAEIAEVRAEIAEVKSGQKILFWAVGVLVTAQVANIVLLVSLVVRL